MKRASSISTGICSRSHQRPGLRGSAIGAYGPPAGARARSRRPQPADHRERGRASPNRNRASSATLEKNAREFGIEYFAIRTSATASCMSSAPSRAFRCPAPRSSAAIPIPPPMAASARSPSGSAPAKSSMCWPRRPCSSAKSKSMQKCGSRETSGSPASPPRIWSLHITGVLGAAGGTGYVIEYTGSAIRAASALGGG